MKLKDWVILSDDSYYNVGRAGQIDAIDNQDGNAFLIVKGVNSIPIRAERFRLLKGTNVILGQIFCLVPIDSLEPEEIDRDIQWWFEEDMANDARANILKSEDRETLVLPVQQLPEKFQMKIKDQIALEWEKLVPETK